MILNENFGPEIQDWPSFRELIVNEEHFSGERLENLIQRYGMSKKAKRELGFRRRFHIESEYLPNDCRQSKYLGKTIAESPYNLVFVYGDGEITHPFSGLSFDTKDGANFVVTQIQGLTSTHYGKNWKDLRMNKDLMKQFRWDRTLLNYLVEILSLLDAETLTVLGARSQRWLNRSYSALMTHYPERFDRKGGKEDFMTLDDDEMEAIVVEHIGRGIPRKNLIHMFPARALKRYDECPLEVGFEPVEGVDDLGNLTRNYVYRF